VHIADAVLPHDARNAAVFGSSSFLSDEQLAVVAIGKSKAPIAHRKELLSALIKSAFSFDLAPTVKLRDLTP